MQKFEVKGHEPSILPDNMNFKLVWSDEFDGKELDMTKWDYRLHMMGKRHRTWQPEGVELDGNSNLVFTVFEKDGEICSTQLQTGYNYMDAPRAERDCWDGGLVWPIGKFKEHKFLHKYGYYECRCKLQKKPGWWSAFWLQSPIIGCCPDTSVAGVENDIMESFEPGKIICHCNHYNGYGDDHECAVAGDGMEVELDAYHTFGMLWTKDGYTFYVDGKEDGHVSNPVSDTPQFILISTEVNGYRAKELTATEEAKAAVGDQFIVDYIRVFDCID